MAYILERSTILYGIIHRLFASSKRTGKSRNFAGTSKILARLNSQLTKIRVSVLVKLFYEADLFLSTVFHSTIIIIDFFIPNTCMPYYDDIIVLTNASGNRKLKYLQLISARWLLTGRSISHNPF